jgi:hypothetical protein
MRLQSLVVCALSLLLGSACTLLSDLAVHQCVSSSDCDILDGSIRRCVNEQCVAGCESNHHCSEFDPRAPICPTPGAECASLTSDDGSCYVSSTYDDSSMGQMVGSDLTIVGAFAHTLGSSTWLSLGLAADELNAASLAGSPALAPTLVVLCRGGDDAVKSMEHLAGSLGSTAVVASLEGVPLDAIRQHPDLSGRMLLLSPNPAEAAPEGDDARLLWYLGGRYADAAPAYIALIRRLQRNIEARLVPNRGLRIASLISAAREDVLLSNAVEVALELDGRNTNYLFREDRFRRFRLSDDSPAARAAVPADIAAYAPDLVLVFAAGEFQTPAGEPRLGILRALEEAAEGSEWSPFYLLGPRALGDDTTAQLAASAERFRSNTIGLSLDRGWDPGRREGLLGRFAAAFPEASLTSLYPAFNAYDALYYVAYATGVARAQRRASSADALMDGLARVTDPGADCVDTGPGGIGAASEAILAGAPFQLCGVTGAARFTPDHARGGQASLFCWTPSSVATTVDVSSVLSAPDPSVGGECAPTISSLGGAP